jgi:hypothetical protein
MEDSPDPMPPALINKLLREQSLSTSTLATGDLLAATVATKAYTQRKLLAMSPRILSRLESLMDGSNLAVSMTAASKLADLSPALRIDPSGSALPASDSLPASAIEALLAGLRPLMELALKTPPPPEPMEPPKIAPRRKARHVPRD